MKVIDLLNKIANGEKVPKKIKYNNKIYEYTYEIDWYLREDLKSELFIDKKYLNDEIEIIEDTSKEDKKIEKIDLPIPSLSPQLLFLSTKINEIIDRLNGEDNE